MWLLGTTSLAHSEFFDDNTPHYAILSHTWGSEEVTFQDIQGPHEGISNRAGYKKVKDFCAKALEAGFKFVWIDTCCIDKTNSVELSEAINSMFRWYRNSITCYAYLADVTPNDSPFVASRWFTRGWTLQELIAPSDMLFFDKYWNEIGSRESLRVIIEEVTGIPQRVLLLDASLRDHCIAEIMSWAARRETTRLEDRAYSLLGLFGVSMPLIYGEGEQAFTRLQLEIMKSSTDHSLFAWTAPEISDLAHLGPQRGVLATSPDRFKNSGGLLRSVPTPDTSAYEMTNLGLRITLPCSKFQNSDNKILAHLNCKVDVPDDEVVGIWLAKARMEDGQYVGRFFRFQHDVIIHTRESWNRNPKPTSLYIIQPISSLIQPSWQYGFKSPQTWSLDYSDLFKAGYLLEAYRTGHEDFQASHQKENRISFVLGKSWEFTWPSVIFFKHPDRAARVWIAISFNGEILWAVINGSIDMNDTPEVILKDDPFDRANKRWDGDFVEHILPKTVFEDETLTLTVKRAIFLDQVGFMMRIAVLDHKKQDLVEHHLGPRPKRRTISLRDLAEPDFYGPLDTFGALVKVS